MISRNRTVLADRGLAEPPLDTCHHFATAANLGISTTGVAIPGACDAAHADSADVGEVGYLRSSMPLHSSSILGWGWCDSE